MLRFDDCAVTIGKSLEVLLRQYPVEPANPHLSPAGVVANWFSPPFPRNSG